MAFWLLPDLSTRYPNISLRAVAIRVMNKISNNLFIIYSDPLFIVFYFKKSSSFDAKSSQMTSKEALNIMFNKPIDVRF